MSSRAAHAEPWGHASPLDDVAASVAIVGVGETDYTSASGRSARAMGAEAAARAIADAGLEPDDVDGLVYSGAFADFDATAFREHFGTAHDLWVSPLGGGMTGAAMAPYLACGAIRRREAQVIVNVFPVAWATERAADRGGPAEVHTRQSRKAGLEVPFGWFPQPVYFATIMRRHMYEFGTTPEQLGEIAVAFRRHARLNPSAVMREKPMELADYLEAPMLADPLRLLDSCPVSDGAGAFVMTATERARDLAQPPVVAAGVGEGTSHAGTHWAQQGDFTSTPQVFAAPGAFAMAGITPDDVDVLTLYDPFTIVALMQIEDMGFCAKGEAGPFVEHGRLAHDGDGLPCNPHGGLLSHAYVLGIAHVIECVRQLRGTAAAQVRGCDVAVYGGYTGMQAASLVLTRDGGIP